MNRRLPIVFVMLAVCLSLISGCKKSEKKFVSIGTGSQTGVYYPAGGAIARLVNARQDEYGINMSAQSTGGSVYNINAVLDGTLEFGIAQSDRQYQAVKGLAEWQDRGPQTKLRAVCSLHPEMVTIIAADDAGIKTLADLKDKRVSIGDPGSGMQQNARDVLGAAGIDPDGGAMDTQQIRPAEGSSMIQDDRLDAFFFTVGHPNGTVKEAAAGQRRRIRLVEITGMDALLAKYPYYTKATIAVADYPKLLNEQDVPTISVRATLITSADVDADVVYAVTRELFENLEDFKASHPNFAQPTPASMLEGLSAPLHEGAKRYFIEAGLIDSE